jgi:hypothetical protein
MRTPPSLKRPISPSKDRNMPPKKKPTAKKKAAAKRPRVRQAVPRIVPEARIVPEVVGSVAGVVVPQDPFVGVQIKYVLEMVVLRRLARGEETLHPEGWVTEVNRKLRLINVTTLRELVLESPTLNRSLHQAGQMILHLSTMTDMMAEVARMIQWPGEPDPEPPESEPESA